MNTRNAPFLRRVATMTLLSAAAAGVAWFAGYRINETDSLPKGIWRVTDSPDPLERGQIVSFCPNDESPEIKLAIARHYLTNLGSCPGSVPMMFKRIIALPGDVLSLDGNGFTVNGKLLPNTKPLAADGLRQPLPRLQRSQTVVGDGELWVASDHTPYSFDSRYFGPISVDSINGQATPIWIIED